LMSRRTITSSGAGDPAVEIEQGDRRQTDEHAAGGRWIGVKPSIRSSCDSPVSRTMRRNQRPTTSQR
jgi:hypothetical protein